MVERREVGRGGRGGVEERVPWMGRREGGKPEGRPLEAWGVRWTAGDR